MDFSKICIRLPIKQWSIHPASCLECSVESIMWWWWWGTIFHFKKLSAILHSCILNRVLMYFMIKACAVCNLNISKADYLKIQLKMIIRIQSFPMTFFCMLFFPRLHRVRSWVQQFNMTDNFGSHVITLFMCPLY